MAYPFLATIAAWLLGFGLAKNLPESCRGLLLPRPASALMVNHEIAFRKCGFGLLIAYA